MTAAPALHEVTRPQAPQWTRASASLREKLERELAEKEAELARLEKAKLMRRWVP